jgi:hypothetical protein
MRAFGLGLSFLLACTACVRSMADLQAARRRWAATRPEAYEMTVARACYCREETTAPVVVTVRGGVISGQRYAATGAPVATGNSQAYPDVDGLFTVVEDALRRHADHVSVTYDRQRGFPVSIRIDYETHMADEERAYVVRAFRPL